MPTLDDALELAAHGWEVLPLAGKVPRTAHGVDDATTDPTQIRRWWSGGLEHDVGARVPGALIVLDFDPQNGGSVAALEVAAGITLPPTLTVESGRGNGSQHRYYLRPDFPASRRRLPAGIDVKTRTGYCVVPPSRHVLTGQPYTWHLLPPVALPELMLDLLRPDPPARRPLARLGTSLSRKLDGLAAVVRSAGEGNRNNALHWAACRAVDDGQPEAAFDVLVSAAVAAGLSEREARTTVRSAQRAGASA